MLFSWSDVIAAKRKITGDLSALRERVGVKGKYTSSFPHAAPAFA